MKALATTQRWIWLFRHQPLTVRLLAAAAALLTAAAAFAPPAEANQVDDDFVAALSQSGVHYGDPGNAVALGQSICPMLAKPGGTFAAAVSKVEGGGISGGMAGMFAQIAIQMYCPQVIGGLASGNLSGLPKIPGMPGVPGVPGI
jgi:Protein of unknown function (DUF732)